MFRSLISLTLQLTMLCLGISPIFGQEPTQFSPDSTIEVRPHFQPHIGPLLGLHGPGTPFLELGLSRADASTGIVGWEISALRKLDAEEAIWGISGGYFAAFAFFEWGIRGSVFTNFAQTEAYLKPYLGLGVGGILTVQYGVNISVLRRRQPDPFARIHVLSVVGRWPISL